MGDYAAITSRKVNLVNPPSAPGTTANREGAAGMGVVYAHAGGFLYPPHTLAAVAAALRHAGCQVRAFDGAVAQVTPDAAEADVIGVFVSYASLATDLRFIDDLRRQTSAKLVLFGSAMRFLGKRILEQAAVDAVLVGEPEGFFAAALAHLDGAAGESMRLLTPGALGVPGYDEQGFLRVLDGLPFPAWDLLPHEEYALLTVLSSRGCPDQCIYCPYAAAQEHRWRARSVEDLLAELSWLDERFQPARLVFRDPVFAFDRERVAETCMGIVSRGLNLKWECESRPEHFDAQLLRLMQRAGCQWIKIGLETTDEQLLQQLGRVDSAAQARQYLQHVSEVVHICSEIGLRCRLFVMAGLPGQDTSMAQATRQFVEALHPAALNVKLCEPYPGTGLPLLTEGDREAQMELLLQAQRAMQEARPSLLKRGRRWLGRLWSREEHE